MLTKKKILIGGVIVLALPVMWFIGWVQGMRLIQDQGFNWQRVNDATRAHYLIGLAARLREGHHDEVIGELEADALIALWTSSQDHWKKATLDVSRWDEATVKHWQEAKVYFAEHPETLNRDRPTNFKVVRELLSQIPDLERQGLEQDFAKIYTGKSPPALHLQEWIGPAVTLADLRGKVVLLDFWHIDCPGCLTRTPHLQELQSRYGRKDLRVIAIHSSRMGNFEKARRFLRSKRCDFSVGLDEGGTTEANYAVQAWPTYYLLDRTGRLMWGPSHDLPGEDVLMEALGIQK